MEISLITIGLSILNYSGNIGWNNCSFDWNYDAILIQLCRTTKKYDMKDHKACKSKMFHIYLDQIRQEIKI